MICIYSLKIPYTSGFNKIAKNQILIKYTEFKYGIYKNVYKPYINRIISVYIFLIGICHTVICHMDNFLMP